MFLRVPMFLRVCSYVEIETPTTTQADTKAKTTRTSRPQSDMLDVSCIKCPNVSIDICN